MKELWILWRRPRRHFYVSYIYAEESFVEFSTGFRDKVNSLLPPSPTPKIYESILNGRWLFVWRIKRALACVFRIRYSKKPIFERNPLNSCAKRTPTRQNETKITFISVGITRAGRARSVFLNYLYSSVLFSKNKNSFFRRFLLFRAEHYYCTYINTYTPDKRS